MFPVSSILPTLTRDRTLPNATLATSDSNNFLHIGYRPLLNGRISTRNLWCRTWTFWETLSVNENEQYSTADEVCSGIHAHQRVFVPKVRRAT